MADKTFREDLYFRISAVPITIPPLRDRGDDVLLLAEHFLERFKREFRKPALEFTEDARARLRTYSVARQRSRIAKRDRARRHSRERRQESTRPLCSCPPPKPSAAELPDGMLEEEFLWEGPLEEVSQRAVDARGAIQDPERACANQSGTRRAPPKSSASPTKLSCTKSAASAWKTSVDSGVHLAVEISLRALCFVSVISVVKVLPSLVFLLPLRTLRLCGEFVLAFLPSMQHNAAEIPRLKARICRIRTPPSTAQVPRRRKFSNGRRQVRVRFTASGNCAADSRKNLPEIESKDTRQRPAARLGKLQDAHFPARLQHARNFPQAMLVVRKVAKAKSRGDQIEARIRETGDSARPLRRKRRCSRRWLLSRAPAPAFPRRSQRRTIGATVAPRVALKRKGQVAGAAAQIEHARLRPPRMCWKRSAVRRRQTRSSENESR